jgi:hypothetical protein
MKNLTKTEKNSIKRTMLIDFLTLTTIIKTKKAIIPTHIKPAVKPTCGHS